MSLQSGFFNSIDDDRAKNAEFFSKYFASLIGNGIFPNPATNFQVVSNDGMTIIVTKGSAWINGTFCYDEFDYITTLDVADGVLNRIDRVVLRLDTIDREIKILVKKGDYATNAVAPELQRDADAYELALADIAVNRGIISITQANITDLRLNKELCGIVHGVVDQVDTTAIFNQFESWYAQTKANYDADIATWTQEKKQDFDTWYTTNINEFTDRFNTWFSSNTTAWDNEFTEWFDTIRGQLEGDIAANLTAEIIELQNTKADKTALAIVEEDLGSHKAESANIKHKAKEIGLQDDTDKFTATNVEGALKESMDRADEAFTYGNNRKIETVDALLSVDDSLPITSGNNWGEVINAIGGISTGKKWVSGTFVLKWTSTYSRQNHTVSHGFGSTPSIVIITTTSGFVLECEVNILGTVYSGTNPSDPSQNLMPDSLTVNSSVVRTEWYAASTRTEEFSYIIVE